MGTRSRTTRRGWAWIDPALWIVAILVLSPLIYRLAGLAIRLAASIRW